MDGAVGSVKRQTAMGTREDQERSPNYGHSGQRAK